jgi:putative ABC transport system substrate-binding protein
MSPAPEAKAMPKPVGTRRVPGAISTTVFMLVLACFLSFAEGALAAADYRLGYLHIGSASDASAQFDLFRKALRNLGYVEGQNLVIDTRYAENRPERLAQLAAELVRLKVDVIVAASGRAALGAKNATRSIPIVMTSSGDAVRQGIVASLARPGGNVTGLTVISPDLSQKRLEILRQFLPGLSRVGVLWCGASRVVGRLEWAETVAAAKLLQVQLYSLETSNREGLANAFALAAREKVQAILMFDCSALHPSVNQIVELSRKHRLPAMYPFPRYADAGGLLSYGASEQDRPVQAASYVDKILKGANPADLPVQQPVRFELVINLKAAKVLNLKVPDSLKVRADRMIE